MAVIKDLIIGADGLALVVASVSGGDAFIHCDAQDSESVLSIVREAETVSEPCDMYFADGVFHAYPLRPTTIHVFNWSTKQWEDQRTLQDHKDAKWEAMKAARDAAERSTFVWNGYTIDADMARINGAATGAIIAQAASQTYEDVWTLADNSTIPVNGQDILAMCLALAAHVSACHAHGRALRQQILDCTTKEQVDAIEWTFP